ncbi:N-acetyl-alpha-D-glucosaminyl L-malate synthase BshA [Agrobacterium tumefaciens]|uniref:N-acetyl-alpha-D-glucosaminyl L-malate synthase BshA n=1 Tax=Agrobacterium tumefaciens TaxID=358 RepID=UPI00046F1209
MRIGVVCLAGPGGAGVVATQVGTGLAARGHQVHFISNARPYRLRGDEKNVAFHPAALNDYYILQPQPYPLMLAGKIAALANDLQLDVLHSHYALPHSVSCFLAMQQISRDIKLVTTVHGTDITMYHSDPELQPMVSLALRESHAITAVSDWLKMETERLYHPSTFIKRIYNFVDVRDYPLKPRNSGTPKVLIHISNFRDIKRVGDVLSIFEIVRKSIPCRMVFLGDGPERNDIAKRVEQSDGRADVEFMGNRLDIPDLISQADVMLLPSSSESFGLVALEAMACGVPTIATTVGGIPEAISHGETGLLSKLGDVENMARDVLRLLTDDTLYQTFSANCVIRAEKAFRREDILDEYEELLLSVAGQPSANFAVNGARRRMPGYAPI